MAYVDAAADIDPEAYQHWILPKVSRTFALTTPQLPEALERVVGNAYLLCRIADTIEDEPTLGPEETRGFHDEFTAVVAGESSAQGFARRLAPLLSNETPADERELVEQSARIVHMTHGFAPAERAAIECCIGKMCQGMPYYQRRTSLKGLETLADLNGYCYYVAGVVGEMLTELFCAHSSEIARRRTALMGLAASFGQGLQMTNILKDQWEDRARGVCWLPRDVFAENGFALESLSAERSRYDPAFGAALGELIGVAHAHLQNALTYSLLIPPAEIGIRRFCLWAIGFAVLTLRKLQRHPDFTSGSDVKISRRTVKLIVLAINRSIQSDAMLRKWFKWAGYGLPLARLDGDRGVTLPSVSKKAG
jgi:farnesyl-diphosphate farnesyltransferase